MVALACFGQMTPQQLESASSTFNVLSSRQLAQIDAYLLCAIVGGDTPAQAVAGAVGFQALSDRQIQNVIAYELSLIQAGAGRGPQILLDPPHVGPGFNAPNMATYTANNSAYMSIAPGGSSGIVRDLWVNFDQLTTHGMTTNMLNVNLRVYADSNLVIDVPAGLIYGSMYRRSVTNESYANLRSTPFMDTIDVSTNLFEGGAIQTAHLKLAMPFTNGIYCQLFNTYSLSNKAWPFGYFNATCETGQLSFAFNNYRLKSAVMVRTNVTVGGVLVTNLPGTNGLVVGYAESWLNTTNPLDLGSSVEGSEGLQFVTAPGITNTFPGGDDQFMMTDTMANGTFLGQDFGTTHWWQNPVGGTALTQYAIESYRWLVRDHFIWNSASGMNVYVNLGNVNGTAIVIWYYSP